MGLSPICAMSVAASAVLFLGGKPQQGQQPQLSNPHAPTAAHAGFKALYSLDGVLPYDRLGYSIAPLPDLDGDGIGEILAGAPNRDPNNPKHGNAYVVSGASGKVLRAHAGVNYGDRFGRATSAIADLNGDGVPEYVIGATWGESPLGPSGPDLPGTVTLIDGASGIEITTLGGVAAGECFGGGFARLGDVDGDGIPDFGVAARFGGCIGGDPATAFGHIRVLSGADFHVLHQTQGQQMGDYLGGEPMSTCAIGDLDGDGIADIVAGAWAAPGNTMRGQVALISGATGQVLRWIEGANVGDRFGWAVATIGDMDGDGLPDVVVGAPYAGSHQVGQVTIHSSRTGAKLFAAEGKIPEAGFGFSVAVVANPTNSVRGALAIGSPYFDGARGRVELVSLRDGGVIATVDGNNEKEQFGHSVAAVGDLDGNGTTEIAIGAIGSPAGVELGRVTVFTVK